MQKIKYKKIDKKKKWIRIEKYKEKEVKTKKIPIANKERAIQKL